MDRGTRRSCAASNIPLAYVYILSLIRSPDSTLIDSCHPACMFVYFLKPFYCLHFYASGSEDSASPQVNLLPEGKNYASFFGDVTIFTCSANFPAKYPLWEINSQIYRATHLPSGIKATGSEIKIPIKMNITVRCIFKKFLDGAVVNVYSNPSIIRLYNNHGLFAVYIAA